MGATVGASGDDVRLATRHENGLLALPAVGFTLQPFWVGYLVALAICVGWAWRLSREAKQRDAETTEREARLAERREWARWMKEQIADVQSKRKRGA
jgi:hypothetical protein